MTEKLPVGAVLTQSFGFVREHIRAAAILFAALALVSSVNAALFLTAPYRPGAHFPWEGFAFLLAIMLVSTASMTAWYRRVILRPDKDASVDWRVGREEGLLLLAWLKYFGWFFLYGLVMMIPIIIIVVVVISSEGDVPLQIRQILPILFGVAVLPLGLLFWFTGLFFWFIPLLLTFPAAAMGQTLPAKQAVKLARGNRWRLLAVNGGVIVVTGVLNYLVQTSPFGVPVKIVLTAVVTFVAWTWGAAVVANCYHRLADGGPPECASDQVPSA